MAQFFRSFAEDTLAVLPADITQFGGSSDPFTIGEVDGVRVLRTNLVETNNRGAYWVTPSVSGVVEVFGTMYLSGGAANFRTYGGITLYNPSTNGGVSLSFRSAGTGLSAQRLTFSTPSATLFGATINYTTHEWTSPQKMRLRLSGGTVYGKVWPATLDEPADWMLTEDPGSNADGVTKVAAYAGNTRHLYTLNMSMGTDGDPAPTGPVGGARRRSPLLLTPW